MTPDDLRADVPALDGVRYMNTGASSPCPDRVTDAATDFLERFAEEVPAGEGHYPTAFGTYDRVRGRVADFLGSTPEAVALVQSTADGINRVAGAVDLAAGDVVVRTDLEHPAGVLPWERLRRRGVEVRVVGTDRGRVDREAYAEAVADADLVCFSALSWNYGTTLPVADLVETANDAGAFTLVDAVQVPGQRPFDVTDWGADAVAAAGHKWLLGPWGAGFLHVDPDVAAGLEPAAIGYRSVTDPGTDEYELKAGAPRFEVGTTNPAPYAGLAAAMDLLEEVGLGTVENRVEGLTDRLKSAVPSDRLLSPRGFESGLVTLDVADPAGTVEALNERGIVVRDIPDPDAVRASLHVFNDESDVDALVDGLHAVEASGW